MTSILQDLRYAFRRLIKDRRFTLAAVAALALGIGATSAVFTIVNAVLLRSLPFDEPDRVMWVGTRDGQSREFGVSSPDYEDWRRATRTFSGISIIFMNPMNVSADDRAPDRYDGVFISANGFALIGARAAIGRGFIEEDDRPGAPSVMLLSHTVWQSRYGGDQSVIGRTVRVNSEPSTIVGVMPPGMQFPFNTQVWLPMSQMPAAQVRGGRQGRMMMGYGRLADGMTIEQARTEMTGITAQLAKDYPDSNKDITATVTPFSEQVIGNQIRVLFWSLMGAVAFVLLIACANVANLLLARASDRSREIAVRVSIGATRWRIVKQLLVESVLLAFVAGVAGLGLAYFGVRVVRREHPGHRQTVLDAVHDGPRRLRILRGGVPAHRHRVRPGAGDLRVADERQRSDEGWRTLWIGRLPRPALDDGPHRGRADVDRRAALGRGAHDAELSEPLSHGHRRRHVAAGGHAADFSFAFVRDDRIAGALPAAARRAAHRHQRHRGREHDELPAVSRRVPSPSRDRGPPELGAAACRVDGGDRVEVLRCARRAPAARPRLCRHRRRARPRGDDHQPAAGRHVFSGEDPIGRRIRLINDGNMPGAPKFYGATVVGIAPIIRQRGFERDPDPVVYITHAQNFGMQMAASLIVRARSDPAAVTALLRQEVTAMDPDVPVTNIRTMEEILARSRWPQRTFGTMFLAFAVIAMVLAAVGLYSVTSYSVSQRTQEIGIRMALGAEEKQVRWLILRRGMVQLGVGLVLGLAGAVGTGRLLQGMLVGTGSADPLTLISISRGADLGGGDGLLLAGAPRDAARSGEGVEVRIVKQSRESRVSPDRESGSRIESKSRKSRRVEESEESRRVEESGSRGSRACRAGLVF